MADGRVRECDLVAAEIEFAAERSTVEQGNDALHRTYPRKALGARAHRFGPGQRFDRIDDHARQNLGSRRTFFVDDREPELGLSDDALFATIERGKPRTLQEARNGLVRRADARTFFLFLEIGRAKRQAIDDQRQTARRDESLGRRKFQPGFGEAIAHEAFQILGRTPLHARRDFLREDFEQQLSHWPHLRPRATLRSRLWPSCARGRYRLGARSPKSRRAHRAD